MKHYDKQKKRNARVQIIDYIYRKLKNQQTNLCDIIKKLTSERWSINKEVIPEGFLGPENGLCLDLGSGYTSIYICQNIYMLKAYFTIYKWNSNFLKIWTGSTYIIWDIACTSFVQHTLCYEGIKKNFNSI